MTAKVFRFEIAAQAKSLPTFRKDMRSLLERAGFEAKAAHDVILSVDEVLANVIRHGYGGNTDEKIHISFSDWGDRAEILIEDHGPCFDPRKVPAPELPSEKAGGLGIHLIRALTDELHYEAVKPVGNRLRLVKYKKYKKGG